MCNLVYSEEVKYKTRYTPERFQYFVDLIKTHKGDYIEFSIEREWSWQDLIYEEIMVNVYKEG